MVQIPIVWNFKDSSFYNSTSGQLVSEVKLNDEWTIVCFWNGNSINSLTPHSIEFRRISTTEEVSISGSLNFTYDSVWTKLLESPQFPEQKISRFMKSGFSSIVINLNDTMSAISFEELFWSLKGVINITPGSTLGNVECDHMLELSNDLGRLLDPETCSFPDVNLKCGDASIPAHKNILSARSPMFATMFKNPMTEVVIKDMDLSTLRIILDYVYTGKLSKLTISSAQDLLLAADKHELEDLKRACCAFLKYNFSLENVLSLLFWGELYCNDLKSYAIDYICNKCTEISVLENTETWKSMKKKRPDLAVDILTCVVKAKEKKMKQN